MNECPKMGTVLVPLNGGLWVKSSSFRQLGLGCFRPLA